MIALYGVLIALLFFHAISYQLCTEAAEELGIYVFVLGKRHTAKSR